MKYIKSVKHPKFVWINDHYDMHLSGTCIYRGELCYFETDYQPNYENRYYEIHDLTRWEKIKWKFRQKLFEICVGYHWSYKNKNRIWNSGIKTRKPKWLFRILMELYY